MLLVYCSDWTVFIYSQLKLLQSLTLIINRKTHMEAMRILQNNFFFGKIESRKS